MTAARWLRAPRSVRNCRPSRRLAVAALEDRSTPVVVTWDGGAGTVSWFDSANWNNPARPDVCGDALPQTGDDVVISATGITITHAAIVTESFHSLSSQAGIDWQNGTLQLAALSFVNGPFNNAGVISIPSGGRLDLNGGGTHTGAFNVGTGAYLGFGGLSTTLGPTSAVTADGTVEFGGTVAVQGTYQVSDTGSTRVSFAGVVDFAGSAPRPGGALVVGAVEGGSADFHGTPLTLSDLTIGDGRGGYERAWLRAGEITVARRLDWGSGTMAGPGRTAIAFGATLNMSSGVGDSGLTWRLDGRALDNYGTADLTAVPAGRKEFVLAAGAVLTNLGDMRITGASEFNFRVAGAGGSVRNAGTLTRAGAAWTLIDAPLENQNGGTVRIIDGARLGLNAGGTHAGAFDVAAGAYLGFGGLNTSMGPTSAVTADGTVEFGGTVAVQGAYQVSDSGTTVLSFGAAVDFAGPSPRPGGTLRIGGPEEAAADFHSASITVANLIIGSGLRRVGEGASVLRAGDITVTGRFDWINGILAGAGTTTIAAGATAIVGNLNDAGGSTYWALDDRILENYGTVALRDLAAPGYDTRKRLELRGGAAIRNHATFRQEGPSSFTLTGDGGAAFDNEQDVIVAGPGLAVDGIAFHNRGAVEIRSGFLTLEGGGISTGTFFGSPGSSLRFGGTTTLTPSSQVLATHVTLDGTLRYQIRGQDIGTGYNPITATGTASLTAAFNLYLVDGFVPPLNGEFRIIDNQGVESVQGTFAGLGEHSEIAVCGNRFRISYLGGSGNDVILTTVEVANSPPVARAGGPYTVVRGGTVTLDASGTTDAEQPNSALLYEWDFDGDGQYDDAIGMRPTFTAAGLNDPETRTVGLRVTDGGGLNDPTEATVEVKVAAELPDPCEPGAVALFVGGTTARDVIVVMPSATAGTIDVRFNGSSVGTFTQSGRVVLYAQTGDDDVQIAGSIAIPAWLYGGDGDDRLKGGAGHDVLLGQAGADLLVGGGGRDLLVGGVGADRIVGNSDDDILIAGVYSGEADTGNLCAIMHEWTRTDRTAEQRVNNLRNGGADALNGTVRLNSGSLVNDSDADVLTGSSGCDWFLFDSTHDRVTDLSDSAFQNDLAFING